MLNNTTPRKIITIILTTLFVIFSHVTFSYDREIERFFTKSKIHGATLNPSGKHTAVVRTKEDGKVITLIDNKTLKEKTLLEVSQHTSQEADIDHIIWIDNRYVAIQLTEKRKGIEDLLDTKLSRRLLFVDSLTDSETDGRVLSVRTKGKLSDPLINVPGKFLYSKNGIYSKIYTLDIEKLALDKKKLGRLDKIDGGQFKKSNERQSVEGYAISWFIDSNGDVKSCLSFNRERHLVLTAFSEDGEHEKIKIWKKDKTNIKATKTKRKNKTDDNEEIKKAPKKIIPIALAQEKHSYYGLDLHEEYEKNIYLVNYEEKTEELIYETSSYKILDILTQPNGELSAVKVIKNGEYYYEYINGNDNGLTTISSDSNPTRSLAYDKSKNGIASLIYSESHNTPGEYLIQRKGVETPHRIGRHGDDSLYKVRSTLVQDSIEVTGLSIPYLLSIPLSNIPAPLVVLPHGGPIGVFDTKYYDTITQVLAESGFAVLRVNFRGSGGHSSKLRDAGKKQWGDLMLKDILSATKMVVKRNDIDGSNTCIFGMSYGGYAASMLTIDYPDVFKCGVNVAGVSDINLLLFSPEHSKETRRWHKEHTGDVESEYDHLKSISPVYNIERLERPIFIAHGVKDKRVSVEHAYRLKLMLEKYDKPYEWYIDTESGHNFYGEDERLKLFGKVIDFLSQHLQQ